MIVLELLERIIGELLSIISSSLKCAEFTHDPSKSTAALVNALVVVAKSETLLYRI